MQLSVSPGDLAVTLCVMCWHFLEDPTKIVPVFQKKTSNFRHRHVQAVQWQNKCKRH